MNRILPYPPTTKPISGAPAARQFDAAVFERFSRLSAFVRLPIDEEFNDAPAAVRNALAQPLPGPFIYVVEVARGAGSLIEHQRQPVQVRAIGFDARRDGVLRDGVVTNTMPDRKSERRELSPGEASLKLYVAYQTP